MTPFLYSFIIGRSSIGVSHPFNALFVFSIHFAIHLSFSVERFIGVAGLIATGLLNDAFTYDSPAIKVILGVGFVGLGVLGTVGTGDVMFGKDVDALLILCSENLVPLLCFRTYEVGIFITYFDFPCGLSSSNDVAWVNGTRNVLERSTP
jgi:hypothetical protein